MDHGDRRDAAFIAVLDFVRIIEERLIEGRDGFAACAVGGVTPVEAAGFAQRFDDLVRTVQTVRQQTIEELKRLGFLQDNSEIILH